MKRYIPLIILIFIAVVAVIIISIMKSNANHYNAYDYIKQKKGSDAYYVREKFKNIIKNVGEYNEKYDPNLDMENGYTLLVYAAHKEDTDFVNRLIHYGADIHKRDRNGNSILTIALQKKDYNRASIIVSEFKLTLNDEEKKKFLKTIEKDDLKAMKWSIENNITLDNFVTVNENFQKFDIDIQTKIVAIGIKLSKKNQQIFRDYYTTQKLNDISKSYKKVSYVLTMNDKLSILNRIVNDKWNYADYRSLLEYLLNDNLKISTTKANELMEEFLYVGGFNGPQNEFRHTLFLYLYQNYPSIFDKNKILKSIIFHHWSDVLQMLLNDGATNKVEFAKLIPYDKRDIELLKILIDNRYKPSKAQYDNYYKYIKSEGNYYFKYNKQNKLHVAISSNERNTFVATLNNTTSKLSVTEFDDKQKSIWTYTLAGKNHFNAVNNVAGLYYFNEKIILLQRLIIGSYKKVKLTVLNQNGSKFKTLLIDGEYIKIVFEKEKFFLETKKDKKYFDKNITEIDSYIPKERINSQKKSFNHWDVNIQTKYLWDKTLTLNSTYPNEISKLYIENIYDKTKSVITLGTKDKLILDVTNTKTANYIIAQTLNSSTIEKFDLDYGVIGYHYIKQEEGNEKNISSIKHIMDEVKLKNKNTVIVGQNNDLPTLEIYNTQNKKIVDKSYKFSYMRGHIVNVKELSNGDIIIIGRLYQNYNIRKVFVALVNADAMPKWSRIYDEYRYLDNIELGDDSFISLADNFPLQISLKDGTIIEKYKEIVDADGLARSSTGRLYAIANQKTKTRDIYQPIIYCYSKDNKSVKKSIVGKKGSYIRNIYSEDGDVYAEFEFPKDGGSLKSNKIITQITKECKLNHLWEKK